MMLSRFVRACCGHDQIGLWCRKRELDGEVANCLLGSRVNFVLFGVDRDWAHA
jgi:hypothetical protein